MVNDPKWLTLAKNYIGIREIPGPKHNNKIVQFWIDMKASFRDDETPWCGAFVGGVLAQSGLKAYPQGAAARAWMNYGTKLPKPAYGCVVVFWRNSPQSGSGHVGFVVGKDKAGNLMVLGGNQGDMVCVKPFDKNRIVGFIWPTSDTSGVDYNLPIVQSDGRLSNNEA